MAKNKQNKGFKGLKEPKMEKASIGGKTIKQKVLQAEAEGSTDHLSPVFSFVDTCPNHFQLADWQGQELKSLIDTMRDLGKLKWGEVRNQKGFKPVSPKTFSRPWPEYVSPEIAVYECRVTKRARLFGYRTRNVFNIVWFDRNHEVYDMS